MATREELRSEWEEAPEDPPKWADEDALIATELEGVVHLRLRRRMPRASGEGSIGPSRAWVSAPSTEWEPAEPEGAARPE